jgi:nifR3 family TIM-barrel protein
MGNLGFWEKFTKDKRGNNNPFFVLAPMADVTDPAFRQIICKYSRHKEEGGGPDVVWTEFVSADGLTHEIGRQSLLRDLSYTEMERPIVAQLFSSNPEKMRKAAEIVAGLGFDGIDINMGCPDRTIEKQGAGACMMKTPEVAVEIIRAAKEGIKDAGKNIPISVKTRVGYNKVEIDTWIPTILREGVAVLTVHARTRKDLSLVPANWDYIKEVVKLRDSLGVNTLIIGNGDVRDVEDGIEKSKNTGCDGIMIGRAVFGNPWIFDRRQTKSTVSKYTKIKEYIGGILLRFGWKTNAHKYWLHREEIVPLSEKLKVLVEHSELFEKLLGDVKHFSIMKKHFKAYAHGFKGAKELRTELMDNGNNAKAVKEIVDKFLNK